MRGTSETPCAGLSELFDSHDRFDHLEARAYCTHCPIAFDCLDDALHQSRGGPQRGVPDGTWGGLLWRNGHIVTTRSPDARSFKRGPERRTA